MDLSKENIELAIQQENNNHRLDKIISDQYPDISRTHIQKCILQGSVFVNSKVVTKKNQRVFSGDIIKFNPTKIVPQNNYHNEPINIPLEILYEDEYLAVINKPAHLVVHPGHGNHDVTLINAIRYHFPSLSEVGGEQRPGIVHRLDKETSGAIVIAKDNNIHVAMSELFLQRKIEKSYIALCIGMYQEFHGVIDAPIGRRRGDPTRFSIVKSGKESITKFQIIDTHSGISLIKFTPQTGRTHQIRVHSSYKGLPIVCDSLYGGDKKRVLTLPPLERPFAYKIYSFFQRHALHAWKISFVHPKTNEKVFFTAPFHNDFKSAIPLFNQDFLNREQITPT